jgi:hypothetical protein
MFATVLQSNEHKIMTVYEEGVGSTNYANHFDIPFATEEHIDKVKEKFRNKTLYSYPNMDRGTLIRVRDFELRPMTFEEVENYEYILDEVA